MGGDTNEALLNIYEGYDDPTGAPTPGGIPPRYRTVFEDGFNSLLSQQVTTSAVDTADADATYDQNEIDLLNELKAQVNSLLAELKS